MKGIALTQPWTPWIVEGGGLAMADCRLSGGSAITLRSAVVGASPIIARRGGFLLGQPGGDSQDLTAFELCSILPYVASETAEKKVKTLGTEIRVHLGILHWHFASGLWKEANHPLEGERR